MGIIVLKFDKHISKYNQKRQQPYWSHKKISCLDLAIYVPSTLYSLKAVLSCAGPLVYSYLSVGDCNIWKDSIQKSSC